MTQLSENQNPRRGRVFPERQLSPEEKARRQAEDEEFNQRCQEIFERVQPQLIKEHYDWFMVIEPDSGDYFIDPDESVARQKAKEKHQGKKRLIVRINETGACGKI
jgi:C4-type Zn-finger protein